jgi:hypothetical protein
VGEQVGSFSIENRSAVMPTTAGRTLDVSAGGEAGIDWANVGSPTTTVNLSGTTVKTATDVETDTANIQTRIPAALVSGRIDASVGAMATGAITTTAFAAGAIDAAAIATDAIGSNEISAAAVTKIQTGLATPTNITAATGITVSAIGAGVITATSIAADAITDAKVAADVTIASVTGAVGSVTGAVGSVTGNVGGNVTGSVGSVAAGGITAASIATDAIDSDAIAASAVSEIQSGLSTLDAAGVRTAVGLAAANLDTQLSAIDDFLDTEVSAIKAKTDNLPAAPAATGDIPSAATVADAVWDEARSGHTTSGTYGEANSTIVSGACITGTLSTTACTTDLTEATDDHYIGRTIIWVTGVLTGQASAITDYNGTTKLLTYTAVTEAPANADRFVLV